MRRSIATGAVAGLAALTLLTSGAGAASAAPNNKNSFSPGTATCAQFAGPLEVTFNRSEKAPVGFLAGRHVLLARHVDATFTFSVLAADGTVLATTSDSFEEDIANGVQPGMRITECTFDFRNTEEAEVTAELIAEFAEFGVELDPELIGETVTLVWEASGTIDAQVVGKP